MMNRTDTFLRVSDVERVTGLRRATIYEWIGKGRFPIQLRLGPRQVAWLESEARGRPKVLGDICGWLFAELATIIAQAQGVSVKPAAKQDP